MEIRWLGHSSFLITTSEGVRIITDPYETGSYGGGIGYGPIGLEADIVTISHDQHEDHNYTETIGGDFVVVKGVVTEEVRGVTIRGIASFHDNSQGNERGENTIFCIEGDGISVCHLGDLGHLLSGVQVDEIDEVDILLIPIGGTYTIDPGEAKEIAGALRPAVVIPMHFKTDKCAFPIASVEEFVDGESNVRRPGTYGVRYTREDLPVETEIVVLEHAL